LSGFSWRTFWEELYSFDLVLLGVETTLLGTKDPLIYGYLLLGVVGPKNIYNSYRTLPLGEHLPQC